MTWTSRIAILAFAACLAPAAVIAQAPKKVAVVPTMVAKSPAENGPLVTAAVRESLTKKGYAVTGPDQVEKAIKAQSLDLTKLQNTRTLGALRDALQVDFVVYPRVLSVGTALGTGDHQATLIVNVQGKSNASFVHTRQLSQPFKKADQEDQVMTAADAAAAVSKLLEGFYASNPAK